MGENLENNKTERQNLPQLLMEIFNRVNAKIIELLKHADEDENTSEYQHIYLLLDDILQKISAIKEQNLNNLTAENLFVLDMYADDAIKEFEKVYGNKTDKVTAKPN